MGVSETNSAQPCQARKENSPTSGLSCFLVARGGADQGLSILLALPLLVNFRSVSIGGGVDRLRGKLSTGIPLTQHACVWCAIVLVLNCLSNQTKVGSSQSSLQSD